MMEWIDKLPFWPLGAFALLLALAPFAPEPHLVEKLRMLSEGTLTKPIDILDLFWHSWAPVLFAVRAYREFTG